MKPWKKRWKSELDEITPDLREDVKNAPIPSTEHIDGNGGNTAVLSLNGKRIITAVAVLTALVLCAVILCVCLIKPTKLNGDFVFTLEINPAVTMSADENGIVTGVVASNSDADVILSDGDARNRIEGKGIAEAVTLYADYAVKLGYIDLEQKGSAVRISGYGNGELLTTAQTSLESYFMGKGAFVAVVAESVGDREFSLRSGFSADDLTKYIKDGAVLYSDRNAKDLNLQELQALYSELFVKNKLFDRVNASLSDNIGRVIKNAEDIQNLSQLYFAIFNHEDNPMKPFGDFWTVKKIYGDSLSGEFAELMSEMQTALDGYKADYGVDITGIAQLTDAVNSYLKIPTGTLATLLENLSFDKFKELSADIAEILQIAGLISSDFAGFLQAPQSIDEYLEKTSAIIRQEYRSRLEAFVDKYNKYRQPIEKTDYDTYIDGIIKQYGSLNEFWQTVKN